MRILITGGCGFIGTSLVGPLKKEFPTASIVIVDSFVEGTPEDLAEVSEFDIYDENVDGNNRVKLLQADICDYPAMVKVTEHTDVIIHLAANTGVAPSVADPRMDMENNVIGTFNLLDAARQNGVKKLIFASSGAPAGTVAPPIHEELPAHPVSPYGASKLAGEGYCSAFSKSFGIKTICLRFGNVYGPRSKRKTSVIAKFIRQAVNGEQCEIYGDGKQTRDFIYIDDLIKAIILSIHSDVDCEVFQIACGKEKTVEEVAQLISDVLLTKNIQMNIRFGSARIGDVSRNYSDTSKARKVLGWKSEMDLEKGIVKTVDFFLSNKANI